MSDLNWCTQCDNAISPFSESLYCSEQCLRADALRNHPLLGYDWHEFVDFPRPAPNKVTLATSFVMPASRRRAITPTSFSISQQQPPEERQQKQSPSSPAVASSVSASSSSSMTPTSSSSHMSMSNASSESTYPSSSIPPSGSSSPALTASSSPPSSLSSSLHSTHCPLFKFELSPARTTTHTSKKPVESHFMLTSLDRP